MIERLKAWGMVSHVLATAAGPPWWMPGVEHSHRIHQGVAVDDPATEKQRSRAISLRSSARQLRRDVDQRPWLDPAVANEALGRAVEYDAEAATIEAKLKGSP